jgi:hypothetical protein
VFFFTAAPARAQYAKRAVEDVATGEAYHIEFSGGFWSPTADLAIASSQFDIPGTVINAKNDLGLTDQHFGEIHVVLRPAKKHKFRFQFIPMKYEQEHQLTRTIVFNGQNYSVGIPVESTLEWRAFRFGYEYDFISSSRVIAGFMLDAKYTDVTATLSEPGETDFAHAQAPIPAIGGLVRVYVMPNISITAELSGIKIPDSVSKKYNAHYADFDAYGTLNIINNAGVQVGWRSFDVGYVFNKDSGSFVLSGLYFAGVVRY